MAKKILIPSPVIKKQTNNKHPAKQFKRIKVKKTNRRHKKQSVVINNSLLDWLDVDYPALKVLITNRRKELIKKQTQAESMMLKLLSKQQSRIERGHSQFSFGNVEFNYPFVVDPAKSWFYFADFYFKDLGIVIELDGKYHQEESQQQKDNYKDNWYSSKGFRVLRVTNEAFIQTGYERFGELLKRYATVPEGTVRRMDKPIQNTPK